MKLGRPRNKVSNAAACRRWRESHPAEFAFANKRNKLARAMCVQWVKRCYPDIYAQFLKDSKRILPLAVLKEFKAIY